MTVGTANLRTPPSYLWEPAMVWLDNGVYCVLAGRTPSRAGIRLEEGLVAGTSLMLLHNVPPWYCPLMGGAWPPLGCGANTLTTGGGAGGGGVTGVDVITGASTAAAWTFSLFLFISSSSCSCEIFL